MEDDGGGDEKIIAVPTSRITQRYVNVKSYADLPEITRQQIEHFFVHYKDLEPGKWVKLQGWGGVEEARKLIVEAIRAPRDADGPPGNEDRCVRYRTHGRALRLSRPGKTGTPRADLQPLRRSIDHPAAGGRLPDAAGHRRHDDLAGRARAGLFRRGDRGARHARAAVELRSAVQTAESSQRGFIVTGNEIYLAPYDTRQGAGAAPARDR